MGSAATVAVLRGPGGGLGAGAGIVTAVVAGAVAAVFGGSRVQVSGPTGAMTVVLVPIVAYFFLRDWDVFVERVAALIPRAYLPTVSRLARESDAVLGGFLRGQFMVMIAMGVFYAVGLQMVGLDLGILIGIVAGLLTFVPYVGPASLLVLGAALCFALVAVAVALGLAIIIASGFGYKVSFVHVFPTFAEKK